MVGVDNLMMYPYMFNPAKIMLGKVEPSSIHSSKMLGKVEPSSVYCRKMLGTVEPGSVCSNKNAEKSGTRFHSFQQSAVKNGIPH